MSLFFRASLEEQLAEIINLNRARKARAKDGARAVAKANRAAHGRTKIERQTAETERAKASRLLDGARLEPPEDD
jgi:hypothetical protein